MQLSFRARVFAIAATAAVALILLFVASAITSAYTSARLAEIQDRHLPKLELGPRLQGQLERLQRDFQDAVAARDDEALAATQAVERQLLEQLDAAVPTLTAGQIAVVRGAIDDYYVAGLDVSRRLLAGETGERLVDAMGTMQAKQARAADTLATVTHLDRGELARAFQEAQRAQRTMTSTRLVASVLCLVMVLLLSFWLGRSLIRSVADVAGGLRRFGRGDFSHPIPIVSHDEIGELATLANQMATDLQKASADRDEVDWLKEAVAGLSQEIRGELEPEEVAHRALAFIAPYLGAPAGAIFYREDGGDLALLGQYAGMPEGTEMEAPSRRRLRMGEGLVGQAALGHRIVTVIEPPAGYLRIRSGLGEAAPQAIVLVPLEQLRDVRGVLELALFGKSTARAEKALTVIRETLVIALEVAQGRAKLRGLLTETRRQADKLAQQEEELRAANEELQSQHEELLRSNQELVEQADELDAQRQALERNNVELETARRGLEQKATELSTVSAYKSQFLANMSHELRTPLNSMLLLSNLLAENEEKTLSDKQVEFARTIHTAGRDLLRLINQVLDLAKIEAGKQEVTVEPVEVREMTQRLGAVFRPLAADKRLQLIVEVDPAVPETIETDAQRLEQILGNLLGNAIKFTEKGEVRLRIGTIPADPDLLSFAVSDTGLGISPADQERIFAPFEQVDRAIDRRFGGTGLGLSISRELAGLLRGTLRLDSTLGVGSTFSLTIPRIWAAGAASSRPIRELPAPPPPSFLPPGVRAAPASSGRLLLIEDDLPFAEAVAEVIRGQGLDCLMAPDGQTGLRLAREQRPIGIVLDVRLPDTDGWRLMEELRFDRATAGIPVHFVSALDEAARGMALGAVGYLTKPASREDILKVIHSLRPPTNAGLGRVLVVEDDEITGDSVTRQLETEKLEVRRARNAAEAAAALEGEEFGCVVLDLSLPDMDGLRLLNKLRERHGTNLPPIVIYTARILTKGELGALQAHSDAVVLKDGASTERLLDEVRLFSRRIRDGATPRKNAATPVVPTTLELAGKRVLIAEDDMRTAYALSATLRAKGVDVHVADTGKAAIDSLQSTADIQAVLMDVMMPEMDGLEAMRRIRRDPRFQSLPIIALTAKAMKGDREMCLDAGATEYLPKPVDGNRLLTMLNDLLAGGEP